MTQVLGDRVDVAQVGLVVAGMLAGGATWYLTDGILPPAAVMAFAFLAILLTERYG